MNNNFMKKGSKKTDVLDEIDSPEEAAMPDESTEALPIKKASPKKSKGKMGQAERIALVLKGLRK